MSSGIILGAIGIYTLGFGLMVFTIYIIRKRNRDKLEKELSRLETLKNLIISPSILTEMEKVKTLLNSEKMEDKYNKWDKRYKKIEREDIPKLTDKLTDAEALIEEKNFKEASFSLARAELDIYFVKTDMELLLDDIREITQSEERNRNAVTKLKTLYREIVTKYNNNKGDYKGMEKSIDLQFDNINKLFSAFERVMENNDYEEVAKITHALDDLIKNIKVVIDETPTVILMCTMILPKKINEINNLSLKMKKDGYNIDYMKLEHNIGEAQKKISEIYDKLKVLNLEDSIFELKTILDYFESLYGDFDKEKQSKKEYEMYMSTITEKLSRLTNVIKNIYVELDELRETYALTQDELNSSLISVSCSLARTSSSLRLPRLFIIDSKSSSVFAIFTLTNSHSLARRLYGVTFVKVLSFTCLNWSFSMTNSLFIISKLTEIRAILKDAKNKIKEYKLPVIPKVYYVELDEAKEGIMSIVKELEKKPIVISDLNTRVDTGRDLVLKLYTHSKELTKTAQMAELAMVYGNRYRSTYREIDIDLRKAENEFRKGDYKKSLELSLNTLNIVEPGIHKKLLSAYED